MDLHDKNYKCVIFQVNMHSNNFWVTSEFFLFQMEFCFIDL